MYAIALDIGTSGFRAQLIDAETSETIKTVVTMGHPLPGGNVIDHLEFAIVTGEDVANKVMLQTFVKMIDAFGVDPKEIVRIAVCGNPIQLSLFQNSEIRDLAYAGEEMQKKLGVHNVIRGARRFPAKELFEGICPLDNCEILIPPAIKHEIGADALAMMTETDFMKQDKPCMVTDYGTNAEMAIKVNGRIITGSAAAGPSIEGQGVTCGMLASPGAISDVNVEGDKGYWRLTILDAAMQSVKGDLVDPKTGDVIEAGPIVPVGITGTGVISCMSLALKTGLVEKLPKPVCGQINLGHDIFITEKDIVEVGKAVGAIRAAQLTLMEAAGVGYDELEETYISGATGTYVDGRKAAFLGSVPNYSKKIIQFGNTSIGLARKLAIDPDSIDKVNEIAGQIQADHLMMATSDTFKDLYVCELAYWEQGMNLEMFDEMVEMYGHKPFPHTENTDMVVTKRVVRDIDDVGKQGMALVHNIGIFLEEPGVNPEGESCIFCRKCEKECPEKAIHIEDNAGKRTVTIDSQKCLGTSCKRCVAVCPKHVIDHSKLKVRSKE